MNPAGNAGAVDNPEDAAPLPGEKGLYLNEFPDSCSHYDRSTAPYGNGNPSEPGGTYTWIIDHNGKAQGTSNVNPYETEAETTHEG